jgi:hypothetical protein
VEVNSHFGDYAECNVCHNGTCISLLARGFSEFRSSLHVPGHTCWQPAQLCTVVCDLCCPHLPTPAQPHTCPTPHLPTLARTLFGAGALTPKDQHTPTTTAVSLNHRLCPTTRAGMTWGGLDSRHRCRHCPVHQAAGDVFSRDLPLPLRPQLEPQLAVHRACGPAEYH